MLMMICTYYIIISAERVGAVTDCVRHCEALHVNRRRRQYVKLWRGQIGEGESGGRGDPSRPDKSRAKPKRHEMCRDQPRAMTVDRQAGLTGWATYRQLGYFLNDLLCVKLELRDGRTDEETRLYVRPSVRSFVSLSVVSVRGAQSGGGNKPRCFIEI